MALLSPLKGLSPQEACARVLVNSCRVELAGWDSALVLGALIQLDLGFIHSGSVFPENLVIS